MGSELNEEIRSIIASRANNRCEYCQSPMEFSTQFFEIDHIIPISKGGSSDLDNYALSCRGCNGHKSNRTHYKDSISDQLVALFHPREDNWSEHFSWDEDIISIIGLTAKGRATVRALKLNRKQLLTLRLLLLQFQYHPPT